MHRYSLQEGFMNMNYADKMNYFLYAFIICIFSELSVLAKQETVDQLANDLQVHYAVLNNIEPVDGQFIGEMSLMYTGETAVTDTDWQIFFCSIRMFEAPILRQGPEYSVQLGSSGINVSHIDGCLHRLHPTDDFPGFTPQESVYLPFNAEHWSITRTDIMPSWYVTSDDSEAKTIVSTAGEGLDFVEPFTTPQQWKRRENDQYNPFTPEDRFEKTAVVDDEDTVKLVIPTPRNMSLGDGLLHLETGDWWVVYASSELEPEAQYLAERLDTIAVGIEEQPVSRYIKLQLDITGEFNDEEYVLETNEEQEVVTMTGSDRAGVFYGAQTLLALRTHDGSLPECTVNDGPRFPYRGMHLDVSRNFHDVDFVEQLLDAMATYKLNTLHLHVTDDEGWRLEIPGIPELTQVGSNRCHDLNEEACILPQLGSGPTPTDQGSGFYTIKDYQHILQYATDRHIRVIPEFDMPGHAHAVIRAMEARAASGVSDYLLSDPDDQSEYLSVQNFRHNAINPCLNSTYAFIEKLMAEIKAMHQDIQPLEYFNFGGDEVAHGAWEASPQCAIYTAIEGLNFTRDELKKHFVMKVASLAKEQGFKLSGWEDGVMEGSEPYDRASLAADEVKAYAWNNIWEWGSGNRAYILANNGYKVVLSHATHFYFDHPQEPDPEARGFYWATRVTDTRKTFAYVADNVYANIDVDRFGNPLDDFCELNECVPLEEENRPNILGLQGQLWSETVRTTEQLGTMVFPRLIALAERAWHKATWEEQASVRRKRRGETGKLAWEEEQEADWQSFANTLGYRELKRLEDMGLTYGIPPPGARFSDNTLEVSTMFPGLSIELSEDGGVTWRTVRESTTVVPDTTILLRTRSAGGSRVSAEITMRGPAGPRSAGLALSTVPYAMLLAAVLVVICLV